MEIPSQLHNFKFVKVAKNSKRPIETDWTKKPHTLKEIQDWVKDGNYGVLGGYGGLVIIDADSPEIGRLVRENLPETFIVKTPGKGEHFYFLCPEITHKIILRTGPKEDEHFGEIMSFLCQVVGPGSIHPTKRTAYTVSHDAPIATVSRELVLGALSGYIDHDGGMMEPLESGTVRISDVIKKCNIQLDQSGNKMIGPHPIHGSTGGVNFSVDLVKNVWHCFRCDTGGGVASLIAVLEGVIDCSEAKPGGLVGEKYLETIKKSKALGFDLKDRTLSAYTDLWGGRLFYNIHGSDLHWCDPLGGWLIWDGARWLRDDILKIESLAEQVIRHMHDQANSQNDKKLKAFAIRREGDSQFRSMISRLRSLEGIPLRSSDFDHDLHLLNLSNKTGDLKTVTVRAHDRADMITRMASVTYNPDAKCPRWERFISEIFQGDEDLIRYVQRAIGYSMTGYVEEHCMFVLYGTGRNGKSTLLKHVSAILGDYAATASAGLLVEKREEGIPNDVARLRGVRMVIVQESKRSNSFDEARVKALTGGDRITARFLNKEFFEFDPTFKIFLATNHKPDVAGTDVGIWRRIKPIPFNKVFTDEDADKDLDNKLRGEYEGILNWMLEGCREWQKRGLGENESVRLATEAYQEETDVMGLFMEECCDVGPGLAISSKELREALNQWTKSSRIRSVRLGEMTEYFEKKRQFRKFKQTMGQRQWFWEGISLKKFWTSVLDGGLGRLTNDQNSGDARTY